MGHNLYSVCHVCKKRIFHFRRKESDSILDFYKVHADCAKKDVENVQTVMDNNGTEPFWMYSKIYEDVEEQD